jgi:hypothetical protein
MVVGEVSVASLELACDGGLVCDGIKVAIQKFRAWLILSLLGLSLRKVYAEYCICEKSSLGILRKVVAEMCIFEGDGIQCLTRYIDCKELQQVLARKDQI